MARTAPAQRTASDAETIMLNNMFPGAWGEEPVEQLAGLDIVDKEELVGVPFLVTQVSFRSNTREVSFCTIDAIDKDGNAFSFQDTSSTGVRAQIVRWLEDHDAEGVVASGEFYSLRLAFPLGLRVSRFLADVKDERTGKIKQQPAKVFYLTMTGKR